MGNDTSMIRVVTREDSRERPVTLAVLEGGVKLDPKGVESAIADVQATVWDNGSWRPEKMMADPDQTPEAQQARLKRAVRSWQV